MSDMLERLWDALDKRLKSVGNTITVPEDDDDFQEAIDDKLESFSGTAYRFTRVMSSGTIIDKTCAARDLLLIMVSCLEQCGISQGLLEAVIDRTIADELAVDTSTDA